MHREFKTKHVHMTNVLAFIILSVLAYVLISNAAYLFQAFLSLICASVFIEARKNDVSVTFEKLQTSVIRTFQSLGTCIGKVLSFIFSLRKIILLFIFLQYIAPYIIVNLLPLTASLSYQWIEVVHFLSLACIFGLTYEVIARFVIHTIRQEKFETSKLVLSDLKKSGVSIPYKHKNGQLCVDVDALLDSLYQGQNDMDSYLLVKNNYLGLSDLAITHNVSE